MAFKLEFNNANLDATKSLLRCLNQRCCPNNSPNQFPIPARRSEDKTAPRNFSCNRFWYNTEKDEMPKNFTGSFAQFKQNVLDRLIFDNGNSYLKCLHNS